MLRALALLPGVTLIAFLFVRFFTYEEPIKGRWPATVLLLSFAAVVIAIASAKKKKEGRRSLPGATLDALHVITGAAGAFVIILKLVLPLLPQVGESYR